MTKKPMVQLMLLLLLLGAAVIAVVFDVVE